MNNPHLLKALREYHWARLRMFGPLTVEEKLERRAALHESERKLSDVRSKHSIAAHRATDGERGSDDGVHVAG
jgi:hypothetical protein